MEFFATTTIVASADELQQRLTISDLSLWCKSIQTVLSSNTSSGEIFCVWGTFRTNREVVRGGVRFSLPDCANVLQWSITTELPPDPQQTIIHLTINRTTQDSDFVETLQQFVDDWKTGLESHW